SVETAAPNGACKKSATNSAGPERRRQGQLSTGESQAGMSKGRETMNAMTKLRCRRGHQRARRILPLLLLTVAAWASVALGPVPRVFALESSASDPARGSGHRTVTFAALLPLTGDSTHSGQAA